MIADLKPYAAYKDPGLPWLGQVPSHWDLVPNRGLVRRRKVLVGKRHSDYQLLSLTKQGVIVRDISTGKGKFSADMGTSQEVRDGDLVFCLFDVPETPRTVGRSVHSGMITGAYTVFEPLDVSISEYFEQFYLAMDDRKLLSPLYSGLRNTIPAERFLGTKTPLPPPAERAAIVRLLGWATGRLGRAVRAKRKVIMLLTEQKQAIIHRAVTYGLDPSVPLKPSGIPWLGEVPHHWDVVRPKQVLKSRSGGTAAIKNTASPEWQQGYVPAFSASGQDVWLPSPMFHGSGLVLSAVGARCGKTFKASGEWAVVANTHAFMIPEPHSSDYWWYVTNTKDWWVRSGSAQPFVQVSDSLDRKWVLPPPAEQKAIAAFLDKEALRFDKAISHLEREIELLHEYRTRLVADVVTGKLDVREAAAQLPDEVLLSTIEDAAELGEDLNIADEEATA